MKKQLIMAAMLLAAVGCTSTKTEKQTSANPFFEEKYGTPHEIPPFEVFTIDNYREAILKGVEEENEEIKAIIANTEAPTFENTIQAMDETGKLLSKARSVFSSLTSSNSDEEKRALQKEISPILTAHSDDINLNQDLFARVKTVYENMEQLGLNKEQKSLTKKVYDRFVKSGANLSEEDKAKLRELNSKLSAVQLQFSQNLLHET
ncbi:MAG: peptidase M3, partial [Bacteroidaceae bacterium]|nr:peptidase M3 [Bacteroidaceae bacterium]